LSGEPDLSAINIKPAKSSASSSNSNKAQAAKIIELEARIARLEEALDMQWSAQSDDLSSSVSD